MKGANWTTTEKDLLVNYLNETTIDYTLLTKLLNRSKRAIRYKIIRIQNEFNLTKSDNLPEFELNDTNKPFNNFEFTEQVIIKTLLILLAGYIPYFFITKIVVNFI